MTPKNKVSSKASYEISISLEILLVFVAITTIFCLLKVYGITKDFLTSLRTRVLKEIITCVEKHQNPEHFAKLKHLINQYPDLINYKYNANGKTPFLKACELGATTVVNEMIKNGADINHKNNEGNGPFYYATYQLIKNPTCRDASCLRSLYYAGCNINAQNKKGYTPLHLAAYHGHTPLIKWLMAKGADTEVQPYPAGLALANGCSSAACLIIKGPSTNCVKVTDSVKSNLKKPQRCEECGKCPDCCTCSKKRVTRPIK